MLELPKDPTSTLELADWLELYAMLSPDQNSSQGDLESALRRAALFELGEDEAIELKTLDTFDELEQRVKAAEEAYPFDLDYKTLKLKSNWEGFAVYSFCLCLSYFGSNNMEPRKLFEQLSCYAAKGYLDGDAIGFGSPRRELPSPFPKAISRMCYLIGEGEGYRQQPSLNRKDDTLDLVAWKDFNDKWTSKVLMFGQCASGRNWEGKLGELQPKAFVDQWVQPSFVSPDPIRSFFVPHRIERDKWDFCARKAGVLFDRCRIAFWAHQEKADYGPHMTWVKEMLARISIMS